MYALRDLTAPAPAIAGESDGMAEAALHLQAAARGRLSPSVGVIAPLPASTPPTTTMVKAIMFRPGAGRMDKDTRRSCRISPPPSPVVTMPLRTAPLRTSAATTIKGIGTGAVGVSTGRPKEFGL